MGRLEGFREGTNSKQIRVRPICQAQELPRQGLPKMSNTAGGSLVAQAKSSFAQIVSPYGCWQFSAIRRLW